MPPAPRYTRYGSLDCIVVDGGDTPSLPVILCHGYGAPGHDLAGLALEWLDRLGDAAEPLRFVFPAAPHDLADVGLPGGRAWWPINMARLAELAQADSFEKLHDEHPPQLEESRERLSDAIVAVNEELAGRETPLVLGGFSQGAMLTMDLALRGSSPPPIALFQFSGTLICRDAWEPRLQRLAATKVFQSHGTMDGILPFSSARALRDLLIGHGIDVEFHEFDGPHTIDTGAVERTTEILRHIGQSSTETQR